MKKHTSEKPYLAVHFTKMCFLNLLKKKLWDQQCQSTKYCLLAEDTVQVSIFSLHMITLSKQHRFIL